MQIYRFEVKYTDFERHVYAVKKIFTVFRT